MITSDPTSRDQRCPGGGIARSVGPGGLAAVASMLVATGLTFAADPILNTCGQLLLKLACLWAVVLGTLRFRPARPGFWWLVAGYFAFAAIRNVSRVMLAVSDGTWTMIAGSGWELFWNLLAGAGMGGAAILLLVSRRRRGNWALGDAWVLGAALLVTMVRLTTIPLAQQLGFGSTFGNIGVVSVLRDCACVTAILALAYSEPIRARLVTVVGAAMALMALSSLAYNAVGANLATVQVLSSPAVLILGGIQSLCQIVLATAALLPAMRGVPAPADELRPSWGRSRTVVMCAAVLAPIIVLVVSPSSQNSAARTVLIAGLGMVLVLTVLRLRTAVTSANESLNELSHLAFHDQLTGLQNRRALQQRIIPALAEQVDRRGAVAISCCYLDVDDLKSVNDRLSHADGDALLAAMAGSLQSAVTGANTMIVRFGGDEFLALTVLDGIDPAGEADRVGRTLDGAVNRSCSDPDRPELRASVGSSWTVVRPDGGPTEQQLRHVIHQADLAQVAAKDAGGRRVRHYDDELGRRARRRTTVTAGLDSAWARGEMTLAYQPVVTLTDNTVYGAEALLRWSHPELGAVPPPEAIQAAEDLGVIEALGLDILDRALRDLASVGPTPLRVGVNLSAHQLRPAAIDRILEHISRTGLAEHLWLEVTEQVIVEERGYAAGALNDLRQSGVIVAIDDFGTGYCGLDYLCTLPVDIVKLDGVFARHTDSQTRQRVARLGAQLADAIGAETLAEGIESYEIAQRMQDIGFRFGQGYAFRRPASSLAAAIEALPARGSGPSADALSIRGR